MVIRIVPTAYAQTNYLFHCVTLLTHTKLGHDCHRQSLVAVGMNRTTWSLLRLNSTKPPTVQKMFRTLRLSPVCLKSDHIARRDSITRQNSFVELSRVERCDRGFRIATSALPGLKYRKGKSAGPGRAGPGVPGRARPGLLTLFD